MSGYSALCFSLGMMLLVACGGNETGSKPGHQKQPVKKDTVTQYNPEKYEAEVTDSLLDSDTQFRVHIKKSTLMDRFVVQTMELDDHIEKMIYRDYALHIKVTVADSVLMDTVLTKNSFPQIGDKEFLSQAIMYGAWIDQFNRQEQEVVLSCNATVPETDWTYQFTITVNTQGKKEIVLESIE